MSTTFRQALRNVVVPLLILTAGGSLVFLYVRWVSSRNGVRLASIAVAAEPSVLAWSPDGRYLAAGTANSLRTSYRGVHAFGGELPESPGKVWIVDMGAEAVVATIVTDLGVTGLAFSPDGKWLAVATRDFGHGNSEAELVLYAVPGFEAKHKAKSNGAKPGYFQDLAWAADSRSLHAIDHSPKHGATVRRWTVPEFVEQSAISLESGYIDALAVAPDGLTLAVVQHGGTPSTTRPASTLHLFNLEKGTEISPPFRYAEGGTGFLDGYGPVGFTADSKAVGVFVRSNTTKDADGKPQFVSWWDVATGAAVSPLNAGFAVEPARLAESRYFAISPDMRTLARAWNGHGVTRSSMESPEAGIQFKRRDPAKAWYWDFAKMGAVRHEHPPLAVPAPPALAFSPDGKKLAGTLELSSGWTIVVWAAP